MPAKSCLKYIWSKTKKSPEPEPEPELPPRTILKESRSSKKKVEENEEKEEKEEKEEIEINDGNPVPLNPVYKQNSNPVSPNPVYKQNSNPVPLLLTPVELTGEQKKQVINACVNNLPALSLIVPNNYFKDMSLMVVKINNALNSEALKKDGSSIVRFTSGRIYIVSIADYKSIVSDIVGEWMDKYLKTETEIWLYKHFRAIANTIQYQFNDHSGEDYEKLFYWKDETARFPLTSKTEEFISFIDSLIHNNGKKWQQTIVDNSN